MSASVGLFFGPAGASDKEKVGIGANRLCIGFWRANSGDGGALVFG